MAITLTGSGGLFTRLGKIFKWVEQMETHQGDISTRIDNIVAAYSADPDFANGLAASKLANQLAAADPFLALRRIAHTTLIEMADADTPLPQKTADAALRELIRQMEDDSETIAQSDTTIGGAVAHGDNTGTGTVIASEIASDGDLVQYVRPETVAFDCIRDAQLRGVEGNEVFAVNGTRAFSDIRHPDWPGGSGYGSTIRVSSPSDAAGTATGRQALTNGDFEKFTVTDTPDNWTVVVGTPGTDFEEEGSTVYRGNKALKINGDGSTLVKLTQQFGTTGQTTAKLIPNTLYSFTALINVSGSTAAGALRMRLEDSGGSTIGSASLSTGLAAFAGDGWTRITSSAITPGVIPSGAKFTLDLTTAITNGESVIVDDVLCAPMIQLGAPGSGHFLIVPGNVSFKIRDRISITFNNDYAGAIGKHMDRFFDLYHSGLIIPHVDGGAETIADTLIA